MPTRVWHEIQIEAVQSWAEACAGERVPQAGHRSHAGPWRRDDGDAGLDRRGRGAVSEPAVTVTADDMVPTSPKFSTVKLDLKLKKFEGPMF
jgi:hypothetical protein